MKKLVKRFARRTVLVTGAGQNLGLGLAARFTAEGATVFVNDKSGSEVRRAVAALRRQGFEHVIGAPADISRPEEVAKMFRLIRKHCQRLDVLVNNAAHLGVGFSFLDTPLEFFEQVVKVNLTGSFLVAQHAARMMAAQGGGAIVNIGSNVSRRANHKRAAYIASKGGIDALTLAMALDLAPQHIRVNTVAPGYIHTDRWATLLDQTKQRRRTNVPLGREVTADDIAEAVMFLASEAASGITGARLVVDGGCSAQLVPADIDV